MQNFIKMIWLMALPLLISGCGKTTQEKLVGTWECIPTEGGSSAFTLNQDNTLSMTYSTGSWGILTPTIVHVSGSWKMSGENIVLNYTQSTFASDKIVGMIDSEKLISVADNSFTTINEKGETTTYTRKY